MTETWKPVVGFEGSYEVSNLGRVRSLSRSWLQLTRSGSVCEHRVAGKLLRPGRKGSGHLTVSLGRGNSRQVHCLVLEAFVGPRPDGLECRHADGDETNNCLDNLSWDTRGNNNRDKKWHKGAKNQKLSPVQIAEIRHQQCHAYYGQGADLAREYGVSASEISSIKHRVLHHDV